LTEVLCRTPISLYEYSEIQAAPSLSPDVINFGKMNLKDNFVLLHTLKAYGGSVNVSPLVLYLHTRCR